MQSESEARASTFQIRKADWKTSVGTGECFFQDKQDTAKFDAGK